MLRRPGEHRGGFPSPMNRATLPIGETAPASYLEWGFWRNVLDIHGFASSGRTGTARGNGVFMDHLFKKCPREYPQPRRPRKRQGYSTKGGRVTFNTNHGSHSSATLSTEVKQSLTPSTARPCYGKRKRWVPLHRLSAAECQTFLKSTLNTCAGDLLQAQVVDAENSLRLSSTPSSFVFMLFSWHLNPLVNRLQSPASKSASSHVLPSPTPNSRCRSARSDTRVIKLIRV